MSLSLLPFVEALYVRRRTDHGRTGPLIAACQVGTTAGGEVIEADYFVKLRGNLDLGVRALARECMASMLAACLGQTTPAPAVVVIGEELAQAEQREPIKHDLSRSIGLNFGSAFLGALTNVLLIRKTDEIRSAAEVFAFDMLIQNVDRRPDNPNLHQNQTGYIVFDHETAFAFLDPLSRVLGLTDPCDVPAHQPQRHCLHQTLKGTDDKTLFDGFLARLAGLSDAHLRTMCDAIPAEWRTGDLDRIAQHVAEVRDNAGRFRTGLFKAVV